jgi:PAB-dependent poly(A)-specific ribonuclease subunit 3
MSYAVADGLECHLSNEFNNGRLFKLLLKLDHVCDDSLEDTGDRYMLKLFRNYLFKQVDEGGRQVVDIGHVVYSLNRLDVGEGSQLLLASPDESTVLVVTFSDLKICLENAFAELATTTEVSVSNFCFY